MACTLPGERTEPATKVVDPAGSGVFGDQAGSLSSRYHVCTNSDTSAGVTTPFPSMSLSYSPDPPPTATSANHWFTNAETSAGVSRPLLSQSGVTCAHVMVGATRVPSAKAPAAN